MRALKNKIAKLARYSQHKYLVKGGMTFFWHVGTPNFGDDINPWLFAKILDRPIRLSTNRTQSHFLGMGSILDRVSPHSIVLGSGILSPEMFSKQCAHKYVAVRGELTAELAGCGDQVLRGDPMVVIDQFVRPSPNKQEFLGLIPHIDSYDYFQTEFGKTHFIIDPSLRPERVIELIGSCKHIASQSLHGLIVADALEVPNIWLAPSENMRGGAFKFHDYFTTIDHAKPPISVLEFKSESIGNLPFSVGRYLHCKKEYIENMRRITNVALQMT